ncbi:hypothetical protein D3C80_1382740 [compost metagenome]
MHQAVGQFTVGGEHQQTGGVDVQAADVDPATFLGLGQAVEHRRAPFRVVTGADFTVWLVVHDDAAHGFGGFFALDHAAIDRNRIVQVDALAKGGLYAVDLDPALGNPGLDVAARTHANAREYLLQFLAGWAKFLVVFLIVFFHLGTSRCVDAGQARGIGIVCSGATLAKRPRIIRSWSLART